MKKLLIIILLLLCLTTSASGQFFAPQQKPMLGLQINKAHQLGNPVALWLFNEGSGGQVFDLSGNGIVGTLSGTAPSWSAGKFGSAIQLPATDEYIDFDVTKFNTNIGYISAWVNPATLTQSGTIFSTSDVANDENWFQFKVVSNGTLAVVSEIAGSRDDVRTTETISTNQWTKVAVSTDGSIWKLYINGQSKSLNVILGSNTGEWFSDVPGRDNARIGILARTGNANLFDGLIDHAIIGNRTPTDSEIALLYREPFCMFEPSFNWMLYGGISVTPSGQVIFIN